MTPIKRRTVLQGIGAAAAMSGLKIGAELSGGFTHGVASGDPLSDRVIIWSRFVPDHGGKATCRWELSETATFSTLVNSGEVTSKPESDHTLKVDAKGLKPGTTYYYRFRHNGKSSVTGRTKTLPSGLVANFKIGVASCSNYPQGYFHAYDHMAEADLDLVLHLGDYIYEYADGRYANKQALQHLKRHVLPQHEIVSLEDYRTRYGVYRKDKDLQRVHQNHPFICVWDDHELANNTWKGGAQNHNEGEGDFLTRINQARQAFHEWMPVRSKTKFDTPIYRSFQIGDLADLIMLDTRFHGRDRGYTYQQDLKGNDPASIAEFKRKLGAENRTLLGRDQERWLSEAMNLSGKRGATWQLLGQQVLMGKLPVPKIDSKRMANLELSKGRQQRLDAMKQLSNHDLPLNLDAWDGYPACRERVMKSLLEHANNPVVLAGDTHNAWAFNLANQAQQAIGIELGTPGITSPGLEGFLPPKLIKQALLDASSELHALDTESRGWAELELTPSEARSRWHFVDNILSESYEVTSTAPLVCKAGARRYS